MFSPAGVSPIWQEESKARLSSTAFAFLLSEGDREGGLPNDLLPSPSLSSSSLYGILPDCGCSRERQEEEEGGGVMAEGCPGGSSFSSLHAMLEIYTRDLVPVLEAEMFKAQRCRLEGGGERGGEEQRGFPTETDNQVRWVGL